MFRERVKKIVVRTDLLLVIYILALHEMFHVMKNSMATQTKAVRIHITLGVKYHDQKLEFYYFSIENHWRVLAR